MDMQLPQQSPVFLTSKHNQEALGLRLKKWQEANACFIGSNQLLRANDRVEYDLLLKDLSQCLIAFVGCKVVAAKLPTNKLDFEQKIADGSKLGKWCFWLVDPKHIELIVERLLSQRSSQYDPAAELVISQDFNAYDLIRFKIPHSMMGADFVDKVWTCNENIAQIRNQETPAGCLILTALSSNQKNEDTAAEFAKILDQDLSNITVDMLIEFAEAYGISVNDEGKFILNQREQACLDAMLNVLKEGSEVSFGLNKIASYAAAVLMNYQRESSEDDKSSTNMRYALGCAVQALSLPRNRGLFDSQSFIRGAAKSYEKRFHDIFERQSNFENKKDDDDTLLDWYKMEEKLQNLVGSSASQDGDEAEQGDTEPTFSSEEIELIRSFINNLQADQESFLESYHQLCFIDWTNKLEQLFEIKTKTKKQKLSQMTLDLFDELSKKEAVDKLDEGNKEGGNELLDEQDYHVIDLVDTKPNKLTDEERSQIENFFNEHRSELETNPKVYAEWEKQSCKQNFECTDFVTGLNQMLLSLMSDQFELNAIDLSFDSFRDAEHFNANFNYEMCSYFSIMYGPLLRKLCNLYPSQFVLNLAKDESLDDMPNPLFDFVGFYAYCEDRGKTNERPCLSDSSEKMQLKFTISLRYKNDTGKVIKNTGKLVWSMSSDSVGMKLGQDLKIIKEAKKPLNCTFGRNLFSSVSGRFKSLDLNDLSTFLSDARLPAGAFVVEIDTKNSDYNSLVSNSANAMALSSLIKDNNLERSLVKCFNDKLSELSSDNEDDDDWSDADSDDDSYIEQVKLSFEEFCSLYVQAVEDMLNGKLSLNTVEQLQFKQADLQLKLMSEVKANPIYTELVRLIMSVGLAYDHQARSENEEEFAIATPYNIHSMYSHMLRLERICDFVGRMLSQIMFIDRRKVVFNALTDSQSSMLGPELIASKDITKQCVLQAVQSAFGYTLYKSVDLEYAVGKLGTQGQRNSDYFNQRDFFNNADGQIDIAIEIMEGYVRTHPQVQEHFNILVYNCDNIDLLVRFYTKLANNEFFAAVKTNLYVVNQKSVNLSNDYQIFENIQRSGALDSEGLRKNLSLHLLSIGEVTNLQNMVEIKHASLTASSSKTSLFDMGLIFHACDSLAKFELADMEVCLKPKKHELIYSKSNFSSYKTDEKNSVLLLVPNEQDLPGIVSLHALNFILNHKVYKDEIEQLSQFLQDPQTGTDELVFVNAAVPCYKLSLDASSPAANILKYAHDVSEEVITFDTMLERKQFISLDINLVEYRRAAQGNTSAFVSTYNTSEQGRNFLNELVRILHEDPSSENLQKIQSVALGLSGGLLMHAQIAEIYTNEMMGLVLSRHMLGVLIEQLNNPQAVADFIKDHGISQNKTAKQLSAKLGASNEEEAPKIKRHFSVFFMLDEYAALFGSKTGEIADVLGLDLCMQDNGRYLLRILVLESKFCKDNTQAPASKSMRQTKATAESFFAIFSHDNVMCTVDRELRLKQLVQLLFKEPPKKMKPRMISEIEKALQEGNCDISLTALSCVYQYDDTNQSSSNEVIARSFEYGSTDHNNFRHKPQGLQLIFNPSATQTMLKEFLAEDKHAISSQNMLLSLSEYREFLDLQFTVALDAEPDLNVKVKQAQAMQAKSQAALAQAVQKANKDKAVQETQKAAKAVDADGLSILEPIRENQGFLLQDEQDLLTQTLVAPVNDQPNNESVDLDSTSAEHKVETESAAASEEYSSNGEAEQESSSNENKELPDDEVEIVNHRGVATKETWNDPKIREQRLKRHSCVLSELDSNDPSKAQVITIEVIPSFEKSMLKLQDVCQERESTAVHNTNVAHHQNAARAVQLQTTIPPRRNRLVKGERPYELITLEDASGKQFYFVVALIETIDESNAKALEHFSVEEQTLLKSLQAKLKGNDGIAAEESSEQQDKVDTQSQSQEQEKVLDPVQENEQAKSYDDQSLEQEPSYEPKPDQNQEELAFSEQTNVSDFYESEHEVVQEPEPAPVAKPQRKPSALDLMKRYKIEPQAQDGEKEQATLKLLDDEAGLSEKEREDLERFFMQHSNFEQILLNTHDSYKDEIKKREEWAAEVQTRLCDAFVELGMRPEVKGCHLNPNGAVFKFQGNNQFARDQVEKNRERLLTSYSIRIGFVTVGLGVIEVSVTYDNQGRVAIPYLSICKQRSFNYEMLPDANGELQPSLNSKFLLGLMEDSGQLAYFDLKKAAPHSLIAGGTGSGKSNVLNVLLLDMTLTNSPQNLELILMDPKHGAEFGIFKQLPHVSEVVYDMDRALEVLSDLVDEMNARYDLFAGVASKMGAYQKINDLLELNSLLPEEDRLPRKVVVIDEFADWFQDRNFKKASIDLIRALAAKARAAGIHLILATQRPDKDVVDPQMRSNLGNQIALKTRDVNNSKIILGSSIGSKYDASRLLGRGHMICNFEGSYGNEPFYAQASFIENDMLGRVIEAICKDNQ